MRTLTHFLVWMEFLHVLVWMEFLSVYRVEGFYERCAPQRCAPQRYSLARLLYDFTFEKFDFFTFSASTYLRRIVSIIIVPWRHQNGGDQVRMRSNWTLCLEGLCHVVIKLTRWCICLRQVRVEESSKCSKLCPSKWLPWSAHAQEFKTWNNIETCFLVFDQT